MSKSADVCWQRVESLRGVQTWRDAKPVAALTSPVDIFSGIRNRITERLMTALHPSAIWRDPREASAPAHYRADNTPLAHTMGAACTWLRHHPDLREPPAAADALWSVVMQDHCATELLRVMTALTREYRRKIPRIRALAWESPELGEAEWGAGIVALRCSTGILTRDKPHLSWDTWRRMQDLGERWIWDLADDASRRMNAALR